MLYVMVIHFVLVEILVQLVSNIKRLEQVGTAKLGKNLRGYLLQQEVIPVVPSPPFRDGLESVGHGAPTLFRRLEVVSLLQFGVRLPD